VEVVTRVFDSPLGRTTLSMARSGRLAGIVDHLWHSDGVVADRRERILPNGLLGLVLALGSPHHRVDEDGCRVIPAASFAGLWSRPFVLDHSPTCDTLGIVLRPAGAYALLARDLSELSDVMVDGRELLGRDVAELTERCAETTDVRTRFALVEHWISARLSRTRVPDPAITWIAAEIERTGGDVRVGLLRKETGLSKARLVEGFRHQIGVRPKLYARLVRFSRTLDRLHVGDARLADVALDAGYYDQAHMDAEFRALAGVSPTTFLATRFEEGSGNSAREPR
jgi:AraC-like DNA-binding protein